jgi:glycosyltransferase involved in cell wall biosynthesis
LDLQGYDLVISLSHAAAKNIVVPAGVRHICYCFTPMRYIWDQVRSYLGWARFPLWPLIASLRRWDVRGAGSVEHFVAISKFVAARIRTFYGRDAAVVYPPVDTRRLEASFGLEPFPTFRPFVYAGALVPYKRPELVVRAFNELGLPLLVVGQGAMAATLKGMAKDNVKFAPHVSDRDLAGVLSTCRALVFPGTEDFGLIPVETMACGRPVIAGIRGGVAESVVGAAVGEEVQRDLHTGIFIDRVGDELENLKAAIMWFVKMEERFSSSTCKARAENFSERSFERAWREFCFGVGIPYHTGNSSKGSESQESANRYEATAIPGRRAGTSFKISSAGGSR